MDSNRPYRSFRFIGICIGILALSLGCLCQPASLFRVSTPTPPPPPTDTLEVPTPTSFTLPPVQPGGGGGGELNAEGPWLLIKTDQGLWAVNPDGSGLTQLTSMDYWHSNFEDALQPKGDLVAFITPGGNDYNNMELNLLSLPGGEIFQVQQLTGLEAETDVQAMRAIGEEKSFAWSPDGNQLAFTSAKESGSADLYVYYARTGAVNRLSQDEGQDFSPSWSPDGQNLVYLEANAFGTGAGMDFAGIWTVPNVGGTPEKIASGGVGADIYGWLNNTSVLLSGADYNCFFQNLRLYDLVTRQETVVYPGCIFTAAASRWNSAAMFSNENGTFLFTGEDPTPTQVSQDTNAYIDPMGADDRVFTVRSENGLIATYGTGEYDHLTSPVTSPSFPDVISLVEQEVAEYGAIWAWTSWDLNQPGVWITGPGIEIGQIYDRAAGFPTWDAHNNLLFFAISDYGGFDLYRTTFDAYYSDLTYIAYLDARITALAWLGDKYKDYNP